MAVPSILRSKFRGCLLGALFGDALGAEFEGVYTNEPVPAREFTRFSKEELAKMKASNSKKLYTYTDDSAMTMALCRSLLSEKTFSTNHLAMEFTETYFSDPSRGYGSAVVKVFERIRAENFDDYTKPAREQFDGSGSYGNGAAMRVSPLALFYHNDFESLVETSKQNALITHAHTLGVQGAILQALAVHHSLNTIPGSLDVKEFIEKMLAAAQELEANEKAEGRLQQDKSCDAKATTSYMSQFQHLKEMILNCEGKPSREQVIETLGHGIKAVEAVPAAIFAFLCQSHASFKDAVLYAMSLGGDTDTIASMTGAIAGAYWGDGDIPKEWFDVTECVSEMIRYADDMYDMRVVESQA